MGVYLNPGNENFKIARNSKIYVDKSELISYTNSVIKTEQRYLCVSRPRRFGKSMAANMLSAYYCKTTDSTVLFQSLSVAKDKTYYTHLPRHNVIFLNMQQFLSCTHDIRKMKQLIEKSVLSDLLKAYPDVNYLGPEDLVGVLLDIYAETSESFRSKNTHIYNPRSVVSAILTNHYDNYWNKTETFEALRDYIVMNYSGLKDAIIELLSGARKKIIPIHFPMI